MRLRLTLYKGDHVPNEPVDVDHSFFLLSCLNIARMLPTTQSLDGHP